MSLLGRLCVVVRVAVCGCQGGCLWLLGWLCVVVRVTVCSC